MLKCIKKGLILRNKTQEDLQEEEGYQRASCSSTFLFIMKTKFVDYKLERRLVVSTNQNII